MKTETALKLAALGTEVILLLVLPIREVSASAEGKVKVQRSVLGHGDDYVRDNISAASVSADEIEAAEEGRSDGGHRTRRRSSTVLAQERSSSTGLLSMLAGSKRSAVAFLIAAFFTLLRAGSVAKGPTTTVEETGPAVAPPARLPSSLFSTRLLVCFLALLVIASSLAAPRSRKPMRVTHDGKPKVTLETDNDGNEVVVIGRGWLNEYGFPKQAGSTASVVFDGLKYKLFMSRGLEIDLKGQLEEVKGMIGNGPQLVWTDKSFRWRWGWTEGAELYYSSSHDPVHGFFLSRETHERLHSDIDTEWDLYYLLSTFAREVQKRTTTAPSSGMVEWGDKFEGERNSEPPVSVTRTGGSTTWFVGKGWQDYTRTKMRWGKRELYAYGCKDSQTSIHYQIGDKVFLHLVTSKAIDSALGPLSGAFAKQLQDAFDRMKPDEPLLHLKEVLDDRIYGTLEDHPEGLSDAEPLFRQAQMVVREARAARNKM